MEDKHSLGPLTLEPLSVERIWGEETIHPWYRQPEPGQRIGEVWLTAQQCLVRGLSETLNELASRDPLLFGDPSGDGFPLLIKLLYPRDKLSVQVHPNDQEALQRQGEPRGKTECWYVLSADPGAEILLGFKEALSSEQMRKAIDRGTIEDDLRHVKVESGDMVFVDAGTVHAIGPGMVVLETQQYSDTTYRLWDYGRPRELHLDSGLAVARGVTAAGLVEPQEMAGFRRLISCPYFTVDSFKGAEGQPASLGERTGLQILIPLGEGTSVQAKAEARSEGFALKAGYATLLPAEGISYTLHVPDGVEVVRILGPLA